LGSKFQAGFLLGFLFSFFLFEWFTFSGSLFGYAFNSLVTATAGCLRLATHLSACVTTTLRDCSKFLRSDASFSKSLRQEFDCGSIFTFTAFTACTNFATASAHQGSSWNAFT
jgi:hypothetical protein